MNVENKGTYKVITPAAGMWLTDGDSVSDSVFMPVGADESKWREITTAEKESIEAAHEAPAIEEPTIDDGFMLEQAKAQKVAEIEAYDTSDAVNGFTYQGQAMWIDKATRVGLVNAIECTMTMGEDVITFGIQNVSVTLPCATAMKMMAALEVYALKCYNVTLAHKNAVMALNTIEEVEAYDITAGYPEKLVF